MPIKFLMYNNIFNDVHLLSSINKLNNMLKFCLNNIQLNLIVIMREIQVT